MEIVGILIFARRELTAPDLIQLAKPLGLTPSNVKSCLTRMVQSGELVASGAARKRLYVLSETQVAKRTEIQRRLEVNTEPWNGEWLAISGYLPKTKSMREKVFRSLWFAGFRRVNDLFIRPSWPRLWARENGRLFADLMEGVCIEGRLLANAVDLASLYSLASLDERAMSLSLSLEQQTQHRDNRECFSHLLRTSGQVVQILSHDPLIPPDFVRTDGLHALRLSYRDFSKALRPKAETFLNEVLQGRGATLGRGLTQSSKPIGNHP